MRLSAPTQIVFLISVCLAVVAVLAHFVKIPVATPNQFWILLAGYVVLVAGNVLNKV